MIYYFALGSNPALSTSEIITYLKSEINSDLFDYKRSNKTLYQNILLIETNQQFDADKIIKKLGGTIKIGIIEKELIKTEVKNIERLIIESIKNIAEKVNLGNKFSFGFSNYGKIKINNKLLGMSVKKSLKEAGFASRWVSSRENILSSVIVGQNKLLSNGCEIALIKYDTTILIGRTLAVQDYKGLSERDYGRPARDDRSGMLPPKLSQIMLNLSGAKENTRLIDPFCGSGTILCEALMMGFQNLTGTDISSKAIKDTEINIRWISQKYNIKDFNLNLYTQSATELSLIFPYDRFEYIVTEPYLGPQNIIQNPEKTTKEIESLYSKSIKEFKKILSKEGSVVMIWPIFLKGKKQHFINPNIAGFKPINLLPSDLIKLSSSITNRGTIIYGRPEQRVWREIVMLKKIGE